MEQVSGSHSRQHLRKQYSTSSILNKEIFIMQGQSQCIKYSSGILPGANASSPYWRYFWSKCFSPPRLIVYLYSFYNFLSHHDPAIITPVNSKFLRRRIRVPVQLDTTKILHVLSGPIMALCSALRELFSSDNCGKMTPSVPAL